MSFSLFLVFLFLIWSNIQQRTTGDSKFIKEHGCNKMRCTRAGCHNVQCYVCGKSCTGYDHFNDQTRGGKAENCPLFDNLEERHENELRQAEEEARKKVLEDNPDVDAEIFKIQVSDKVKADEARRKELGGAHVHPALPQVGG